jgi:peptide/nickel transport system permease protein
MLPGDPVWARLHFPFTMEQYELEAARLGLDKPIFIQFLIFFQDVLTGNWGFSQTLVANSEVWVIINQRLPRSAEIMIITMVISTYLGIKIGKRTASKRNKTLDVIVRMIFYIFVSMPAFVLAFFIISTLLVANIDTLPFFSYKSPGIGDPPPVTYSRIIDSIIAGRFDILVDYLAHLLIPVSAMIIVQMVIIAKQTRSSYITVLNLDYIRTAYAKGVPMKDVLSTHSLRNVLPPVVNVIAMGFPAVFTGTVVLEVAFELKGLGQLFHEALQYLDYPIIIALVFAFGIIVIIFNILADLTLTFLDPRIKIF